MKEAIEVVRNDPCPETLKTLINLEEFSHIANKVITYEMGSDGELTVTYLKDMSLMLSLVGAVRECDIEKHLQAERKLLALTFAYDHQNYSRYNTYQNAYLLDLKNSNHPAFNE